MREKKIRKLSLDERVAIRDLLRRHCSKGQSGKAAYAEGWSDARVLEAVRATFPKVEIGSVAYMRARAFGPIRRPPPGEPIAAPESDEGSAMLNSAVRQISALRATVEQQGRKIAALESQVSRLTTMRLDEWQPHVGART